MIDYKTSIHQETVFSDIVWLKRIILIVFVLSKTLSYPIDSFAVPFNKHKAYLSAGENITTAYTIVCVIKFILR